MNVCLSGRVWLPSLTENATIQQPEGSRPEVTRGWMDRPGVERDSVVMLGRRAGHEAPDAGVMRVWTLRA